MDAPDDLAEQLKCKRGDNFAAGRRKHEEKLVALDVGEVNALPLLGC